MFRHLSLLFLFMLSFNGYALESIYIQSIKAKLYQAPSFKSNIVKVAKRGNKLNLLEKKGSWYKVSDNEDSYWVSRLLVSKTKPLDRVSVLSNVNESLKINARVRSSSVIVAAAARGLTADSRKRENEDSEADYYSLRKIEVISISEQEIQQFNK